MNTITLRMMINNGIIRKETVEDIRMYQGRGTYGDLLYATVDWTDAEDFGLTDRILDAHIMEIEPGRITIDLSR